MKAFCVMMFIIEESMKELEEGGSQDNDERQRGT